MVMESKTTSKTSCLKALLLRAWRERWTDIQWGINIKTVLPRGVSGDVYNLADCILQQAVVGAGANPLVLSYLRHSLSAQLVSHAAVLQRLSKFNQLGKIHCVFSLLEFLSGVLPGVTCCGKPEETVLANAVLSVALWLLNILQHCQNTTAIIQKTSDLLKLLLNDDFYVSLMCLARYSDVELYNETSRKCVEVDGMFPDDSDVKKYVKKLENIDVDMLKLKVNSEPWPGSLIQCWLEVSPFKILLRRFGDENVYYGILQNLQNKIVKIISKNSFVNDKMPLNLKMRYELESLVYHYHTLRKNFQSSNSTTRHKSILLPKLVKSVGFKNSYVRAIKTYNTLPKKLKTLNLSKKSIKKNLKDGCKIKHLIKKKDMLLIY